MDSKGWNLETATNFTVAGSSLFNLSSMSFIVSMIICAFSAALSSSAPAFSGPDASWPAGRGGQSLWAFLLSWVFLLIFPYLPF